MRRSAGILAMLVLAVMAGAGCGDDDGTRLPPPAAPPTTAPTTGGSGSPATGSGSVTTAASASAGVDPVSSIDVRLVGGQPEGGLRRRSVGRGQQVRIVITSDRAAEVHLHGYDQTVFVPPAQPTALELTAHTAGVFELEVHGDNRTILELEVR